MWKDKFQVKKWRKKTPTDEDMIKEGWEDSMKYENLNYDMNNGNPVRDLLLTLVVVVGYE